MLGMIISLANLTFRFPGLKVKVTVAIFRKKIVIVLAPYLLMDFNLTSHKC